MPEREEDKEGGAGQQAGARSRKAPIARSSWTFPAGGIDPSSRCQARASGGHWLASGRRPKTLGLAATSRWSEEAQLLRDVRRSCQHEGPLRHRGERRVRRSREATSADQRHRNEGGSEHGGRPPVAVQDASAAGRGARDGMPMTCSTLAPEASASSRHAPRRGAATRVGAAPKPRRSSDDAPPWQRGPAGRRGGAESRGERREDDIERLSMTGGRATTRCRTRARDVGAQRRCQARRVTDATRGRGERACSGARR